MFLFRLALELGKTVQELEDGISKTEVHEWIAYFELVDERSAKNG